MKNKGFSLVELIVVIAIMAILVGVAVPVYSSYIEKANAAKDEQLLGEINSAFNIVCAGTALDINTVTDATITVADDGTINLSAMVVKVGSTEVAGFAAKMVEVLGADLKFNVIERISYDKAAHKFVDATPVAYAYGDTTIYLSPADIAALKASNYATLGISGLLGKVDAAAGVAAGASADSSLYALIMSGDNTKTLAEFLGYGSTTDAGFQNKMQELTTELAKKMAKEAEGSDANYLNYMATAGQQLMANCAVLSASKTQNFDSNAFANSLAEGTAISDIKDAGSEEQLGQVAMAYAMYTSYVTEYNKTATVKKEVSTDIGEVLTTIKSDEGFKTYMTTPQATVDMEGYLAAMNMVGDSAKDPTAVEQLLLNGFADPELAGALSGAIGE